MQWALDSQQLCEWAQPALLPLKVVRDELSAYIWLIATHQKLEYCHNAASLPFNCSPGEQCQWSAGPGQISPWFFKKSLLFLNQIFFVFVVFKSDIFYATSSESCSRHPLRPPSTNCCCQPWSRPLQSLDRHTHSCSPTIMPRAAPGKKILDMPLPEDS